MKLICVTGGVLSGIGKGITGASIGAILKAGGYDVFMQKFDGYLNVDPGTMNPLEHGEVFVTEDGAETDLDIGHYERFIDTHLNASSSWTTGKIYQEVFEKERNGDYLGHTVQIIPHVTALVKEKIKSGFSASNADISILEVGGTIGDMENEYLVESVRQLRQELGAQNVIFVHLVYVPFLGASKELKTKPAQNSVRDLRSRGIDPDFLIVRADHEIEKGITDKLSLMCGIPSHCVIPSATVRSIYQVPTNYQGYQLGNTLLQKLGLPEKGFDMSKWEDLISHIDASQTVKKIALVGKYCDLEDAYYSLNEGLKVAGYWNDLRIQISFVNAEDLEKEGTSLLEGFDGICVPGGFGSRGIEGMFLAAKYAREHKVPYLGICLGSQIMAIEFARNVLGYQDAHSEEFSPESQHCVVHMMEHQRGIHKKGGTMRLGSYECLLKEDSLALRLYGESHISERHRHRYEFNNLFREEFEKNGFHISGTSLDGELVEIVELSDHPFMIATQAHPELKSRPLRPHPLFVGFVGAMK